MYIPLSQLPPRSRVWIYQANRPLTEAEVEEVQPRLVRFVEEWTSHGQRLQASADILHRQFLVVANNEDLNSPSGCSIDASVRFVKELEQHLGVSFFDRTQLAFLQEDEVKLVPLNQVKEKIAAGEVRADSLYFDNLVSDYGNLRKAWIKPARESWLARYF
jgi:hypothetical protein